MGAVPADVVIATFYNFNPALVRSAMDGVWQHTTPEAVLRGPTRRGRLVAATRVRRRGARLGGAGRRRRSRSAGPRSRRGTSGGPAAVRRPCVAAVAGRAAPRRVARAELLREFRGDGHIAALTVEGLSGIEALVLARRVRRRPGRRPAAHLGHGRTSAWAAAVAEHGRTGSRRRVRRRSPTAGRAQRARIEATTDRLGEPRRTQRSARTRAPSCAPTGTQAHRGGRRRRPPGRHDASAAHRRRLTDPRLHCGDADRRGVPADRDRRRRSATSAPTRRRSRSSASRTSSSTTTSSAPTPRCTRRWTGPYNVHTTFHEPFVLFGYLAALTPLELVTGVIILPQRQTALVAKQAAEVDLLTGGRFRLGVGIGWNAVEYEALGQARSRTAGGASRSRSTLLRRLWTERTRHVRGRVRHDHRRRHHPAAGAAADPDLDRRPVQPAYRRVGRLADGWFPQVPPGPKLDEARTVVDAAAPDAGRDPSHARHGRTGELDRRRRRQARRSGRPLARADQRQARRRRAGRPGLVVHGVDRQVGGAGVPPAADVVDELVDAAVGPVDATLHADRRRVATGLLGGVASIDRHAPRRAAGRAAPAGTSRRPAGPTRR